MYFLERLIHWGIMTKDLYVEFRGFVYCRWHKWVAPSMFQEMSADLQLECSGEIFIPSDSEVSWHLSSSSKTSSSVSFIIHILIRQFLYHLKKILLWQAREAIGGTRHPVWGQWSLVWIQGSRTRDGSKMPPYIGQMVATAMDEWREQQRDLAYPCLFRGLSCYAIPSISSQFVFVIP